MFLIVLEAENYRIMALVESVSSEGPLLGCKLLTSCCVLTWWEGARDISGVSFIKA